MPYRTRDSGVDAPVSILLVTSRETRRWVIPKGNPTSGLTPHAAAALEAEEEAGVRGAICPTPLGAYRYLKRQRNGASRMLDVDVFPLAVTQELESWKESGQRERRWFQLAEAADAVEEPDLAALIRSFGASEFMRAARPSTMLEAIARKSRVGPIFAWLARSRPKTEYLFELLEAHALCLVGAAGAICRLLEGGPVMKDQIREVREREHEADDVIREVLHAVRGKDATPFDRGAITKLIGAMDDAIDEMQAAAAVIDLYEVTEFDQEMKDLAAIIVDAARLTAETMPLLRGVARNGGRIHELTARMVRMEGHADDIHAAGLKKAFGRDGADNILKFIVARDIYKHLERITDAFEDVANEVDGIVIDHA